MITPRVITRCLTRVLIRSPHEPQAEGQRYCNAAAAPRESYGLDLMAPRRDVRCVGGALEGMGDVIKWRRMKVVGMLNGAQ